MNTKGQGLMSPEFDRLAIAAGHAAFADWWNKDGLTARDHDPKRRAGSASCQLHAIGYSCGWGDYFEKNSQAAFVYCELVARYYPGEYEAEAAEWTPYEEEE